MLLVWDFLHKSTLSIIQIHFFFWSFGLHVWGPKVAIWIDLSTVNVPVQSTLVQSTIQRVETYFGDSNSFQLGGRLTPG